MISTAYEYINWNIEKSATETTRLLNWLKEIEHDMQIFHYPEVYVYVHTNFAIDFLLDFQTPIRICRM